MLGQVLETGARTGQVLEKDKNGNISNYLLLNVLRSNRKLYRTDIRSLFSAKLTIANDGNKYFTFLPHPLKYQINAI